MFDGNRFLALAASPMRISATVVLLFLDPAHGATVVANTVAPLVEVVEARGWSGYFRQVLGGPNTKQENLAVVSVGRGNSTNATHLILPRG